MERPSIASIRNIGIISHIDAGKTTVSERILFYSGEIHRMGEVHEGEAVMDWMPQEQERGITITATASSCRWKNWHLNLIDTPGHIDFTIEVERSLCSLDGAIAIFSAVEGVQPQSESVWRQADRYEVPRICFINKMDRIGADLHATLRQMREKLNAIPLLLQLPVGSEGAFHGVLDIVAMTISTFSEEDQGRQLQIGTIPTDLLEAAQSAREDLLEQLADIDDDIMKDYLAGVSVESERIYGALKHAVQHCGMVPVFIGSALRNVGIQPLLDGVGMFLPSPLDRKPLSALPENGGVPVSIVCATADPCTALAFKVQSDGGRKLTYLRIYSGSLQAGDALWNSQRGCFEKAGRLFRMHAHKRENLTEAGAGDIIAVGGFKETLTGDTLCTPARKVRLAGLTIPEPVVTLAVEPRTVDDKEKLPAALEKLQWEDPTFRVHEDPETGQTILTGMGELHLEIIVDRLQREYGAGVKTGKPQVIYRETISKSLSRREIVHLESEGRTLHGEVFFRIAPLERGAGVHAELTPSVMELLPKELFSQLVPTALQVCSSGGISGFPVTDLQIEILETPWQQGVTSDAGLAVAIRRGIAAALRDASPTLLEPLVSLEITTPQEAAGKVLGGLQQKRARIEGMNNSGDREIVRALVPLSELFGYMTELRSATKGRGTFTLEIAGYDIAPLEVRRQFGCV